MPTFGIISEGKTDQTVLVRILAGWFSDPRIGWTPIQPPSADDDGRFGGWAMVFKALEVGRHKEALLDNDYVVIQLDTDVSHLYGVPHQDGSVVLSAEELVMRVIKRLKTAIDPDFYAAHSSRFIFAISVHEIECWILLVHDDKLRNAGRTRGCLSAANKELDRKGLPALTRKVRGRETKDTRAYEAASRPLADRRRLLEVRAKDPSLALFILQLDAISAPPAELS